MFLGVRFIPYGMPNQGVDVTWTTGQFPGGPRMLPEKPTDGLVICCLYLLICIFR